MVSYLHIFQHFTENTRRMSWPHYEEDDNSERGNLAWCRQDISPDLQSTWMLCQSHRMEGSSQNHPPNPPYCYNSSVHRSDTRPACSGRDRVDSSPVRPTRFRAGKRKRTNMYELDWKQISYVLSFRVHNDQKTSDTAQFLVRRGLGVKQIRALTGTGSSSRISPGELDLDQTVRIKMIKKLKINDINDIIQ